MMIPKEFKFKLDFLKSFVSKKKKKIQECPGQLIT